MKKTCNECLHSFEKFGWFKRTRYCNQPDVLTIMSPVDGTSVKCSNAREQASSPCGRHGTYFESRRSYIPYANTKSPALYSYSVQRATVDAIPQDWSKNTSNVYGPSHVASTHPAEHTELANLSNAVNMIDTRYRGT